MKNNFQKISLFLFTILFIVLCFVFIFLYKQINKNNQKTESNMVTWQTEAHRRDEINLLNNSLEEVSNNRVLLETHFAKISDIVPLLNTLQALGPSVGATTEVDSVDAGTNNDHLIVELKTSGSFEQVYKFLTLLENSPYEVDFISMDLHKLTVASVTTKNTSNSNWEAIFKIQLLNYIP